jgi:hypothetical protein
MEESNDLDSMELEELIGSLQNYELSLPQPKNKHLDLKTSKKKVVDFSDEDSTNSKEMASLAKKFRKFLIFRKGTNKNLAFDISKVILMEPLEERKKSLRRIRTHDAFDIWSVQALGMFELVTA